MVDSTCENGANCTYSYVNDTSSPNITSISPASITGAGLMTITGLRLKSGSICVVSLYNEITKKITVLTDSSANCTDTSITISIPIIESGYYLVRVRTDPIG